MNTTAPQSIAPNVRKLFFGLSAVGLLVGLSGLAIQDASDPQNIALGRAILGAVGALTIALAWWYGLRPALWARRVVREGDAAKARVVAIEDSAWNAAFRWIGTLAMIRFLSVDEIAICARRITLRFSDAQGATRTMTRRLWIHEDERDPREGDTWRIRFRANSRNDFVALHRLGRHGLGRDS